MKLFKVTLVGYVVAIDNINATDIARTEFKHGGLDTKAIEVKTVPKDWLHAIPYGAKLNPDELTCTEVLNQE